MTHTRVSIINVVIFLCLFPYALSYAQTFKGTVLNSKTKNPVPYADVTRIEDNRKKITNDSGDFEFSIMPSEPFKVQISKHGYRQAVHSINPKSKIPPVFYLKPITHLQLNPITVSATPLATTIEGSVIPIDKRSMEDLREEGYSSTTEMLSLIPGVEQYTVGPGIGKPVIRGLSGNRVVTYYQGVRLENQQYGADHRLGVNSTGIGSVEVIKGPASLLYGADGLGGVIYFIDEPYAPTNKVQGYAQSQFMLNALTSNNQAGLKLNLNNIKWNVFASYNTSADYAVPQGDRVLNTRFRDILAKTALGYHTESFTTDLRYSYLDGIIGIPQEGKLTKDESRTTLPPYQDTKQHALSFESKFFLGNNKISLAIGYNNHRQREIEEGHSEEEHGEEEHGEEEHGEEEHGEEEHGEEEHGEEEHGEEEHEEEEHGEEEHGEEEHGEEEHGEEEHGEEEHGEEEHGEEEHGEEEHGEEEHGEEEHGEENDHHGLDMVLNTVTYNLKGHFPFNSDWFYLVAGTQGMFQFHTNYGDEILIPNSSTIDVGGYVLASVALGKILEVQGGIRLDYRDLNIANYKNSSPINNFYLNWSGSISGVLQVKPIHIKASVSSNFRPPTNAELSSDGVHHGTLRYEIGDPDLVSERSIEVDIEAAYTDNHFNLTLSPFYNFIESYIYIEPQNRDIDNYKVYNYKQIDANLYGGEVSLRYNPHFLSVLQLEASYSSVFAFDIHDNPISLTPANKIRGKVKVSLSKKGQLGIRNIFLSYLYSLEQSRVAQNESITPAYHLLNIGIHGEIPIGIGSLEILAGIHNILNITYQDHLSRLKDFNLPNPGRNFYVTARLNFY